MQSGESSLNKLRNKKPGGGANQAQVRGRAREWRADFNISNVRKLRMCVRMQILRGRIGP